jgi:hypothetical protein
MKWLALVLALVGIVAGILYINRDDPPDLSIAFRCVDRSSGIVTVEDGSEQLARIDLSTVCTGGPVILHDAGRPRALVVTLEGEGEPQVRLPIDPRRIEAEPDGYFLLLDVESQTPFLSIGSI